MPLHVYRHFAVVVLLGILLCACAEERTLKLEGAVMGTRWHVTVAEAPGLVEKDQLRAGIVTELDRIDALMSTWKPDSELSRFNASDPGEWFMVASDTVSVVALAIDVWRLTDGAFDVTVGPLVDLWGFGPTDETSEPDEAEVAAVLADTGCNAIRVRGSPPALRKSDKRRLDLSAIAKGFAVDQVAEYLLELGVEHFLVEVGGELRTSGINPSGQPWSIGIETPAFAVGVPIGAIRVSGRAVATSGDYRNYRIIGGKRLSHTIDPRTGYPVSGNLASVTVVADTAMLADALATGLGVLGVEEALLLAEREHWAIYLIERDGEGFRVHHSRAFSPYL